MKTIEEQAKEFSKFDSAIDIGTDLETYRQGLFEGFIAGYQAAKDELADVGKVMDTCEHILDMEKMVDVNSPNNSNGWISVKERLPEIKEVALVFSKSTFLNVAHRVVDDKGWCWSTPSMSIAPHEITHWMPLPEAPKEEK